VEIEHLGQRQQGEAVGNSVQRWAGVPAQPCLPAGFDGISGSEVPENQNTVRIRVDITI